MEVVSAAQTSTGIQLGLFDAIMDLLVVDPIFYGASRPSVFA